MRKRLDWSGSGQDEVIAALDIGSHKVCCLIASAAPGRRGEGEPGAGIRLLGFGHQRSFGIAGGAVVDMRLAQAAVAAAVSQAEHAAGVRIDAVHVALGGSGQRSRAFKGHVDLPTGVVEDSDIARLDEGAHAYAGRGPEAVIALNRTGFRLDGMPGIAEPRGLAGHRLEADHHAVTAASGAIKNLGNLIASCQLDVSALVPGGYASALAATTEEERRLGVIVIDIGAGTTAIAAFADGVYVAAASMPFGGQHITEDMSQYLGLPLAEAERIKTLYGSVAIAASDEHEPVLLARVSESAVDATVTRGELCRIVRRRIEWILDGIRVCLQEVGTERLSRSAVVLTGGGAEVPGLHALASAVLDRPVRVAGPPRLPGAGGKLPGSVPSPAFSSVIGLALMASRPTPWLPQSATPGRGRIGYLGRVEQWLKESF